MAIAITVSVTRTGAFPSAEVFRTEMRAGVRAGALIVETAAVQNVSGKVLKVQTGELRSSIGTKVVERDNAIEAAVGTHVAHGTIHEFGVQRAWTIEPRGDGPLHFVSQGQHVFAQYARRENMPARPWLIPALRENQDDVVKAITERIAATMQATGGGTGGEST